MDVVSVHGVAVPPGKTFRLADAVDCREGE